MVSPTPLSKNAIRGSSIQNDTAAFQVLFYCAQKLFCIRNFLFYIRFDHDIEIIIIRFIANLKSVCPEYLFSNTLF